MHLYINLFGIAVPSYGFLIAMGVVFANIVAMFVLKKMKLDFNDFIILEAYCILGAFIGAKLLYFIVSFKDIDWERMMEPMYFNEMMQSGFVFYGGLIGGLFFVFIAGRLHKIDAEPYIRNFIFLIPFIHSFGRIGCFMAGCCYGKPYDGVGAVVFPEGIYAPAGIKLFPVQLLEASILMFIVLILLILQFKKNWFYTVETYLISYGISRIGLEYLRYDEIRGGLFGISTSQWISIFLIIIAITSIGFNKNCVKRN